MIRKAYVRPALQVLLKDGQRIAPATGLSAEEREHIRRQLEAAQRLLELRGKGKQ